MNQQSKTNYMEFLQVWAFHFSKCPRGLTLGKRSSKYTTNLVRGFYVLDLVGLECTSYMVAIFCPSECQDVTGSAAQSGLHSL